MYSTLNEGKSVAAERFIRTLKNKSCKHMTATGKNVYYDVLDDVVNECNNTKHSTIKMKPKHVNPYYPNFDFFHKNLRFAVFSSVENDFSSKNSKKNGFSVEGPNY